MLSEVVMPDKARALKQLLGLGLVAASLFLLLSLFTFHTQDTAFLSAPASGTPSNAGGVIGAFAAFRLLYTFGALSSWAMAFLLGAWGVSISLRRGLPDIPYKVTGIIMFLVSLSVVETLVTDGGTSFLPRGGILGIFMTRVVLLTYVGHTGTWLAVFYVTLVSMFLATDFLFVETAFEAVAGFGRAASWFAGVRRSATRRAMEWTERRHSHEQEDERARRGHRARRDRKLAAIEDQHANLVQASWPLAAGGAAAGFAGLSEPPERGAAPPVTGIILPDVNDDEPEDDGAPPAASAAGVEPAAEGPAPEAPAAAQAATETPAAGDPVKAPARAGARKNRIPDTVTDLKPDAGGEDGDDPAAVVRAAPAASGDDDEEAHGAQAPENPAEAEPKADADAGAEEEEPGPETRKKPSGTPKTTREEAPAPEDWDFPPLDILDSPGPPNVEEDKVNERRCDVLEATLATFKITGRVIGFIRGPTITQFELDLAPGTKFNQLVTLQNDLAIGLKVESVRIVRVPGKGTVGVEVPNAVRDRVTLRELVESQEYKNRTFGVPMFLGKDAAGVPIISDLTDMPHIMIAGTTGSGKSVCLNSVIAGILLTRSPSQVRMVLIDPKCVEMAPFKEIPHLLVPVITDHKKAPAVLEGLTDLMDKRYQAFEKLMVRKIASYNRKSREEVVDKLEALGCEPSKIEYPMPYIVVVVDELSDLMLVSSREVENSIIRLAQKARAVGIHLVLSTQRPSADVITTLIRANMPSKIAFQVNANLESRVILDKAGAEQLLGKGDMLFSPPMVAQLVRAQGVYVSDEEIGAIVDCVKRQASPARLMETPERPRPESQEAADDEEKMVEAGDVILASGRASTTLLQRRLAIGYTKASRLCELLEAAGLVGPFRGSKPREIIMTFEEWEAWKKKKGKSA